MKILSSLDLSDKYIVHDVPVFCHNHPTEEDGMNACVKELESVLKDTDWAKIGSVQLMEIMEYNAEDVGGGVIMIKVSELEDVIAMGGYNLHFDSEGLLQYGTDPDWYDFRYGDWLFPTSSPTPIETELSFYGAVRTMMLSKVTFELSGTSLITFNLPARSAFPSAYDSAEFSIVSLDATPIYLVPAGTDYITFDATKRGNATASHAGLAYNQISLKSITEGWLVTMANDAANWSFI